MELLSICIPTYNRRDKLRKLLKELAIYNKQKFKIIISDNASTDGTEEMVKEFIPNGNILYFKNEVNIGMDGNYIEVLKHGKAVSKYSMLIGDDDIPQEDFFVKVPYVLEKYAPDVVISRTRNGHFSSSYYDNEEEYIENNLQESFLLMFENGWQGVVINNELLDIVDAAKYYGCCHVPIGAVVEILTKSYRLNGNAKTYVITKSYIKSSNGDYTLFTPDLLKISLSAYGMLLGWCQNSLQITAKFCLNIMFLWNYWWNDEHIDTIKSSYEAAQFLKRGRITEIEKKDFTWANPFSTLTCENTFFKRYFSGYDNPCFIIFGAGEYGEKCVRLFGVNKNLIKYFVDSDEKKQEETLHGIPIYAPSKIAQESSDSVIVIAVINEKYLNEIKSQIKSMNLSVNKVETIYEFSLELLESLNFKCG